VHVYRYIYTDGSATPGKGSASAGIYCNLFEKLIAAGKYSSNFDGEVMAIWQALEELNKQHLAGRNVVLLIDSVAAIQAVANEESQDKRIILARYEIKSASKRSKGDAPMGPIPLWSARKQKSRLPS
jgi:ribonuclease HI